VTRQKVVPQRAGTTIASRDPGIDNRNCQEAQPYHRDDQDARPTSGVPPLQRRLGICKDRPFPKGGGRDSPIPIGNLQQTNVVVPRIHTAASVKPKYILELFGGTSVLTSACSSKNLNCLYPFELGNGIIFDLRRRATQEIVIDLIKSGRIWYVHLGTPCTVWSRARHNISNFVRAREKERIGVELALFSCEVIRECIRCNVLFSLENPTTSRLFEFAPLVEVMKHASVQTIKFSMCMYGEPYRKNTTIITNCAELSALRKPCNHVRHDVVLEGGAATRAAGRYPDALVNLWAKLLRQAAPAGACTHDSHFVQVILGQLQHAVQRRSKAASSSSKGECSVAKADSSNFDPEAEACSLHHVSRNEATVPDFLDHIIFGQHSKAEAEERSRQRYCRRHRRGSQGTTSTTITFGR